jgi:hypothetical protein
MKTCLLTFLSFYFVAMAWGSCNEVNRIGKMTRYGYPGDSGASDNCKIGKGNRENQLRREGDGLRLIRRKDSAGELGSWITIKQPGSCAILGSNKLKVSGTASKLMDGKKLVSPLIELTMSNGNNVLCCWEDSGSDKTADNALKKDSPQTGDQQILIDRYDPLNEHTGLEAAAKHICKIEVIGHCLHERYSGTKFPKASAATGPLESLLNLEILNPALLIPGITYCEDEHLI